MGVIAGSSLQDVIDGSFEEVDRRGRDEGREGEEWEIGVIQ